MELSSAVSLSKDRRL